jgi:hypothetical protein
MKAQLFRTHRTSIVAVAMIAVVGAACERGHDLTAVDDVALAAMGTAQAAEQSRSDAADRYLFQAQIEPVGDTRVRGILQIRIEDGYFRAKVRATGLASGATVPQHIHVNDTCGAAGGILIAFDDQLRVPGEEGFAAGGPNYPTANRGGVLQYEAERPLADLLAALGVDNLYALNLGDRVFNVHQPALPVIGCGEIRWIN